MNELSTSAQVFLTVNTFADQNDGSATNGLSLRDAILMAHNDPGKEYVINLSEGTYNLTIEGNEDFRFVEEEENFLGLFDQFVARTGDLDIDTNVTIIGVGAEKTIIDASALGDRLFDVKSGGFFTIDNVTVQNGITTGTFDDSGSEDINSYLGGGIRIASGGGATINNSIIKNNRTVFEGEVRPLNNYGGGIGNEGLTEINNSLIIDNISATNGGGIYNLGNMTILNSTIANNQANRDAIFVDAIDGGGGIHNREGGSLLIKNSTISGNTTFFGDGGGGILSEGSQTTVINSTITNNTAAFGSGILSTDAPTPVLLENTIVAKNNQSPSDIEGFFDTNSSYNLIGNANGIIANRNKGNIAGDITKVIDPVIGPLAYNGGLTPTHALLQGSPAINAGSNSVALSRTLDTEPLLTDQRGQTRITDQIVDIGSYEVSSGELSQSLLNTPFYRFQNLNVPGTYLFAGGQESDNIKAYNRQFKDEGFAFNVGIAPNDDLITMYRFQNTSMPGTYLYVGEKERQSVLKNNKNFIEEGIAFYVYSGSANIGQDIYRFQNLSQPGTYIFVGEEERQNILQNFTNFREEGVAFEVVN